MQKIHLAIEGMSCGHCVARVRRALEAVDGVQVSAVQVGSADVELESSTITADELARRVSETGFAARVAARAA